MQTCALEVEPLASEAVERKQDTSYTGLTGRASDGEADRQVCYRVLSWLKPEGLIDVSNMKYNLDYSSSNADLKMIK